MTQHAPDKATHPHRHAQTARRSGDPQALLAEMQALFSVMPGALLAQEGPLPTDDEVEAMFDNMPV